MSHIVAIMVGVIFTGCLWAIDHNSRVKSGYYIEEYCSVDILEIN